MAKREVQTWLDEFLSSKTWLSKRYSPGRIGRALERWMALFAEEAKALGVPQEEMTPLKYFRPSYLRLSPGRSEDEQLRGRARAAVERISKRALLEKARRVPGIEGLDADRLEKWSHQRIASRFSAWEEAIHNAVPDMPEEEAFRFFRLRYLYLPEDRFLNQAIPLGVKNTVHYHKRIGVLESLGIEYGHPDYEQWAPLAEWQFQRKAKKLRLAVERFWDLKLGIPPTSDSINQRDYHRYLKICAGGDYPEILEEMIYKLILYFGAMTHRQLACFLTEAPEDSPWRSYNLDAAAGRLVELGLVEEQSLESDSWYQPSRSIQTELILETWLGKLRSEIRIGTQEALDYLPSGYQRHESHVIARRHIPRATEKIMRDRRRMVSDLYIDRNDPRYNRLIALSRREIEAQMADSRRVLEAFETHSLMIPRELERQLEIFYEEDLKPSDRDVFALVVNLGLASLPQLNKILRRYSNGQRGFALKSSLKRLCAVELLSQDEDELYVVHPSLRELEKVDEEDLAKVVGLLY